MCIQDMKKNIDTELRSYGLDDRKIASASIIVEELLLLYEADPDKVSLSIEKSSKMLQIRMTVPGENRTPRSLEEDCSIYLLDSTVNNAGFEMDHLYQSGNNIVTLTVGHYYTILNNLKYAFSFLRESKRSLISAYILNLAAIAANLMIPFFTGRLVTAYAQNVFEQILLSVLWLLGCRILYQIFIAQAGVRYNHVSNDTGRTFLKPSLWLWTFILLLLLLNLGCFFCFQSLERP